MMGARQQVRPQFLIIGGVGIAIALVLLLVNVLGGGDAAPDQEPAAQPTAPTTGVPPAGDPGAAPDVSPLPVENPELEVFEIFEGRDPFQALVFERPDDENGGGATPAPGSTPAPGVTPAPGGATPVPGGGGGGGGGGGPAPTPAPPAPPAKSKVKVTVVSVTDDNSSAHVKVGSKAFATAKPGETLSDGVRVESIAQSCVVFNRDGDRFRLCEGESLTR